MYPKWSNGIATVGICHHKGNNLRFVLSLQARHEMGHPPAVAIDYDRKRKTLIFKPRPLGERDGYMISVWGQICGAAIINRYKLKDKRNIPIVQTSPGVWEAFLGDEK